MAVPFCQLESGNEQIFEIVFDLKCFAARRAGESWRIENDHVELLTFPCKSRQHHTHVVNNETMIDRFQAIQRKVFASARQIFFGNIDI